MEASSSSSAPPIQQQGYDYEVFLSFRGEDTRKTFTDHLYTDLVDKGIYTFRDDEELSKGEAINPELLKAINHSKVSVPILSKGYASSKWCLMELAQMVKCMEAGNQKILPVFYHVEPRQVRHQEGEYAEAFSENEKKHCPTVVEEWRIALETVGKLKGWHIEDDGYEGRLRSEVVLEILKELKKYQHIDITDNVVGIDDHVDEIMDLLNIGIPDVRIGGIWGMSGSGKTTIAKFMYNHLMDKFDYCSFLSDISEVSKSKGIELLKAQLVSHVLGHQNEKFFNRRRRKHVLRQRLYKRKVLIVLDDVDQAVELDALLQIICSVTAGSRIIITTRNKNVLEAEPKKVDWIYEVKEMDEENALLLFCKRAFRQDFMLPEYDNLSREIVKAIGGIPLAVEVVASYLSSHLENKAVWEEELGRLKRDPKIQEKLRVGTDSLNHEEREIFLDIACIFRGMDRSIPVSMWRACELYPVETINNLLAKCLIKLTEGNKLWMHNLLKDLGREAVRNENRDEPGERSRLWCSEDGLQVLDHEEGTKKVKAICLARSMELEQRHFCGKKFRKLSRLLFLDLGYGNLNVGFESCSSKLKWIGWHGVGKSQLSIPPGLHLKDLVVLDLSESSIGENWEGWNWIQEAKKLEVLNLKSCQQLRRTPHFNSFLPLKRLILEDCHELSVVHSSIGQLTALESLNLKNCRSLERLPDVLGSLFVLTELVIDKVPIESLPVGMENLETLSAKSCELLRELLLSDYASLKKLNISHTPVVQLSFSGRQPRNLQELDISYSSVISFPPSLMELQRLEVINASGCQSLEGEVPTDLGRLTSLRILRLDNTKITSIPEGIRDLCQLEVLDLGNSKCERTLPDLPSSLWSLRVTSRSSKTVVPNLSDLINLKELEFTHCNKLDELPEEMAKLRQLRELNISACYKLASLPELPSGLRRLLISRCSSLSRLPQLSSLQKLRTFSLIECRQIVEIPNLGELKSLRRLTIRAPLVTIHGLEMLSSLVHLSLGECAIRKIEGIHSLCSLKRLTIMNCETLQEVEGIEGLVSLEELWIYQCPALVNFPNLSVMRNLKVLNLQILENLVDMKGLLESVSLESLVISRCNGVDTIPNLSRLKQLKTLQLHALEKLVEIQGLGELLSLDRLVISLCDAIETLPSLSLLQKLRTLKLRGLRKVLEIQGLSGLVSLESLAISHCDKIVSLPGLSMMQNLRELALHSCGQLSDIRGIAELVMLESVVILGCEQINVLTDIPALPNLKTQKVEHEHDIVDELLIHKEFTSLELHSPEITAESLDSSIYGMAFLDNLITHYGTVDHSALLLKVQKMFKLVGFERSEISWVTKISELKWLERLFLLGDCSQALPGLSRLQKLKKLELKNLNYIHGLSELKTFEELLIVVCYALDALPDLSRLQKVKKVELNFCDKLHWLIESEFLEELVIERCNAVDELPNLSRLYKLKKLKLIYCNKLKDIRGLSELESLEELLIESCDAVDALPNLSRLYKLKKLNLIYCEKIKDIHGLNEMESLEELLIKRCDALDALPNLSRLHKLNTLKLIHCEKLKDIHGLSELESLEELLIDRSRALDALPNLSRLEKLKKLELVSCKKLKDIHGLSELESLEELLVAGSLSLDAIPNLSRLQKLKRLALSYCENLRDIHGLSELESLEKLLIEGSPALDVFPNLSRLHKLKELELNFCENLKDIPGLSELKSLEELRIQSWHALEALPNLSRLPKLKKLELRFIEKLKDIHGLGELESFEVLLIQRCHALDVLTMLSSLQKLKRLVLDCCVGLKDMQGLCELECLEELTIESFNSLEALPIPFSLKKLRQLALKSCFRLKNIQGICEMESLEELLIEYCPSLEALPNLTRLQRLKKVQLRFCRELKDIGGLVMENLEDFDICQCPYLK